MMETMGEILLFFHIESFTATLYITGSRLIKPPNKLVELVAQAVDGSPDGLLQVQQIYTYLQ